MNGVFDENQYENAVIDLFRKQGYSYISGSQINRKYTDVLLYEDFYSYIDREYSNYCLSLNEKNRIIAYIERIPNTSLYESSKLLFQRINEGVDLIRDDQSKPSLHFEYIDYNYPEKNIFTVVNQYTVEGIRKRRPDLVVFINGIPITIIEFKSAIKQNTTIYDAWQQISIRYSRDIPNLLRYCFLSVISDGANTKLGTVFTQYNFYYSWNKVNDNDKKDTLGIGSLYSLIAGAFSKNRIIEILRDFIIYPDVSQDDTVVVCRYPQFFAAKKMCRNIMHHLKPFGDGKGGIYFGATGCGKTYTMLFLARLLMLRHPDVFDNPTIILIVDREELDDQAAKLFVNATRFLRTNDVRSIVSREDLGTTLRDRQSGGVYITSIQKFCSSTGLLSDRNNIICISDEAHRSQINTEAKLVQRGDGVYTTYGFAKYLRDSFPNATYCGFTGTPIDEAVAVFGGVVDKYTMKSSCDDGITVGISYEPRLARVIVSNEDAERISDFYEKCSEDGCNEYQIEESKKAMSAMKIILGNPVRLRKMAADIVQHYEALCSEKPAITQKAMIVCADRMLAFKLLKEILHIRPNWGEAHKSDRESLLSKKELEKLKALPKINLVATRSDNDPDALYDKCGTEAYRKMLSEQFKDNNSNFKIAIVVDMWITGFDVPSLAVMYIDKPLQKHTLIQTISRVNRVFEGKDKGIVVDYIGIRNNMMEALKTYGDDNGEVGNPIDELPVALSIFRNYLDLVDRLIYPFDTRDFFYGQPYERLDCLNRAAEYVQRKYETEKNFMGYSQRLKSAYGICFPSGELTDQEVAKAQFYLAIRSIIYKQTIGTRPDAEELNKTVEKMVSDAITCTGIENIIYKQAEDDLFSKEFMNELDEVKMPITKFNALLKLVHSQINEYGRTNKVKAMEFDARLKLVVERYNRRDDLVFTSEVVTDFVDALSDELINIMVDLRSDKKSFEKLGISYEEKVFYDILIKVRDDHKFEYSDDKCLKLATAIKDLVEDKMQYVDWNVRQDIKSQLIVDLTVLLYNNGYPPSWNQEVFDKIFEQAENFKKYI